MPSTVRLRLAGLVILLLVFLTYVACGSRKLHANMPISERMAYAMKQFQDGHYFDARTQFRIVTLNAPGSSVVDTAQFYLAECHFNLEEFIIAASEYEKLIRLYPRSAFLDDAQYKVGLCYFKLSPKSDLDQKYTTKAINEFQRFLDDYPDSPLRAEVIDKLNQARNKLAKKAFNIGNQYRKMTYYTSALIYFDEVLNQYYDTEYYEPSLYYKARVLTKIKKYDEARVTLHRLIDKYQRDRQKAGQQGAGQAVKLSKGKYEARALELLKEVEQELGTNGDTKK